ncbi:MAG TPA: hypothetical protein VHG28_06725 [Longimicrobiaceae bacterium]|nr:hypothetical protein [Longimicrobiaceae bacterium]
MIVAVSGLNVLLGLLAVAGCTALVFRIVRSLLRLGLAAAESTALSGMIEISARRGDLTGLAERRAQEQALRRARLRAAILLLVWTAALVVPPLVGWAREVYALAVLLWFLPASPVLVRRTGQEP